MHNPIGFTLITDQEYINDFFNIFKTPKDVNTKNIQYAFSRNVIRDEKNNKIIKVSLPKYYTTDEFILKAGTLSNVTKDIQTNFGLYLYNMFVINGIFGDRIPYFNPENGLDPKAIKTLQDMIVDKIISGSIDPKEFGDFHNRSYFLAYKGTIFTPGQSFEFVKVNKKVAEAKPRLIKDWKAAVESGKDPATSYIIMVEKPLLDIAKKDLKNDPAWPIYGRGGKPKFGNVYKNCAVTTGPVYDPINNNYTIAENSLMDGVQNQDIPTFANIQMAAAYARGVATQDGGSQTKQIFSAMQSVVVNKTRGSNCGCKRYVKKIITKDNIKQNINRFIIDEANKKIIRITYENVHEYYGKEVMMRTPLFCVDKDFCNICSGDYFYDIGIINVGNTTVKASSTIMNKSMKAMHDVSMDVVTFDPLKYIFKV